MAKRYRAQCDSHGWEGMAQENKADAKKDLEAHMSDDTDGPHTGTRIDEYDI